MSEYICECDEYRSSWGETYRWAREYKEPIVRCRDCKFSHEVEWPEWMNVPSDYLDCCGELVETWDYYNDEPNYNPVKPDGFCSWCVRRDA